MIEHFKYSKPVYLLSMKTFMEQRRKNQFFTGLLTY